MKLLHNDKNLFRDVIETVSQHTGQNIKIIEKDYYVTMILKNLALKIPELVFKGGTSLSKCHQVINRFSEDVDLSTDIPVSQKRRQEIKNTICSVVRDLGLAIVNLEDTHSRRDYNKYIIAFGSVLKQDLDIVNANVVLEMTYISTALPNEKLSVKNIIGNFLNEKRHTFYEEYGLTPFEMKVQSLERTFIDKIFALCDYSMRGEFQRNSRHIYDVYKILKKVKLNGQLKPLVQQARKQRQNTKVAVSAADNVNINLELKKIIDTQCFKNDYEKITMALIYDDIMYSEAIKVLNEVIKSKIFV